MYARAVDQADARLRELRLEERGEVGLGAATVVGAIAATEVLPDLAGPLFVGGLALIVLGVRATWRRWDLLERLSGERDAYVITEVRAFAAREATLERRRSFAALVRCRLREATRLDEARMLAVADELAALASELEDEELALEPDAAVACMRLFSDVAHSPLLNRAMPAADLRSRVRQIRAGFRPRG